MSNSQDRIPIWSGRAVTTGDHDRRAQEDRSERRSEPDVIIEFDADPKAATTNVAAPPAGDQFDSRQHVDDEPVSARPPAPRRRRRRWLRRFVAGIVILVGGSAVFAATAWWDSLGDFDDGGQAVKADQDNEDGADADSAVRADESGSTSAAAGREADEPSGPAFADPSDDGSDPDADRAAVVVQGPPAPGAAEGQVVGLSLSVLRDHRQAAAEEGQSAWAIYTDGRIYLLGGLPDEATGERLAERLQVFLGAGNVTNLLTIDPSIPDPDDPPLFIKETVVFNPGATSLPLGSDWILVAADLLMKRLPETTLTVVANTGGLDAVDRELARLRAETIVDYLVDRGIEQERLDFDSRPEVEADPDDGNKPIEFVVHGLLDNPQLP